MSTVCLFSLDMFPASSLVQVNDAFLRAFVGPRTAAWQPKTPFDLSHYGRKSSQRFFQGRLPQKQHIKRPSTPSGHRCLRRGHLELPCARGFIVFICGKHLRMLIERTDKEWTLCTFNLSFANPPAGESVLRPILRPVHV